MLIEIGYFLLSNFMVLVVSFHLVNILRVKSRLTTLLGEEVTPSAPGYKKLMAFSSSRGIAIAIFIALILVANLLYAADRLINMNTRNSQILLLIVPAFTLLMGIAWASTLRNNNNQKKIDR